jgi:hypothetical protein
VFTDTRLYRARAFEPALGYDDVAFLLDQNGPITGKYKTPFFGIRSVKKVRGPGAHGLLLIWNQGASPVTGYGTPSGTLPPGCPTGSIAAGAVATFPQPTSLNLLQQQLLQFRYAVRPLALTGPKEHDLDVQVLWGQMADYGLPNASPGNVNMADQSQDAADAIDSPAQGANQALPAVFPAVHTRDQENLSESWIFEQNTPTFKVLNNGSGSATGGAVGLRIWGFLYDLAPIADDGQTTWGTRWIAGAFRRAPLSAPDGTPIGRIVTVPTAPFTGQGAY